MSAGLTSVSGHQAGVSGVPGLELAVRGLAAGTAGAKKVTYMDDRAAERQNSKNSTSSANANTNDVSRRNSNNFTAHWNDAVGIGIDAQSMPVRRGDAAAQPVMASPDFSGAITAFLTDGVVAHALCLLAVHRHRQQEK